jgi:NADH oxidase (H2O2-forming)
MRIAVVGCGAAGLTAASYARRTNRSAQVIIIERGGSPAYSRCGLPLLLSGEIQDPQSLLFADREWYRANGMELLLNTKAVGILPKERKLVLSGEHAGELAYDSLILCTGAEPIIPNLPGIGLRNVFTLRGLDDALRILEALRTCRSAVVVGGGGGGLEAAVALRSRGLEVTVVEMLPQILPGLLDPEFALELQKSLEAHGLKFILNSRLEALEGKERVEEVLAGDRHLPCDLVLLCPGVRADLTLATGAGLEVDQRLHAIKVNSRMETSEPGIYAAGDCVCSPSFTGAQILNQLGTTAVRQGKVAGINAAGGRAELPPLVGTFVTKLFDLEIASAGLTEGQARELGTGCVSAAAEVSCRPKYSPERLRLRIKLVASQEGRLLGGQILGPREAGLRAQILGLTLALGKDVGWLASAEFCYHPLVGDVNEPLSTVAEILARKLRR